MNEHATMACMDWRLAVADRDMGENLISEWVASRGWDGSPSPLQLTRPQLGALNAMPL